VKTHGLQASLRDNPTLKQWTNFWTAILLLTTFPCSILAQAAGPVTQSQTTQMPPAQSPVNGSTSTPQDKHAVDAKPVRNADRRRAAKLYLAASKIFEKGQFEKAMRGYALAAKLDPTNDNYSLAESVARSHAVTALVQAAAKDRLRGDQAAARAALAHGLELEPQNFQLREHLYELGDDTLRGQSRPLYEQGAQTVGEESVLAPDVAVHSFHLRTDQRQMTRQVFRAYGIETTMDNSVRYAQVRLDMDNVGFEEATRILQMVTKTFYVPLDAHRVLVAQDTKSNREEFMRQGEETVYLPGLPQTELTDVGNLAKNVFDMRNVAVNLTAGTITLRAPDKTLSAFNATMRELLQGKDQVLLHVRIIQLARTRTRDTGAELPKTMSAVNLYTEEQSILNDNSAAVQEIISSGLASADDPLAILAILIASGDVTSSLFSNGLAMFGGGITASALSPGKVTANLSLNSSESRELDDLRLHLGDGEAATLRSGTRYPIQTSSYSNIVNSNSTTAGLTGAGTSSNLSSLLASYTGSTSTIPQVEYQDLGLTLKATPKIMRNDAVALTLDMEIKALSGSSINDNPILNNNSYSGVVTVKLGEAVVLISNLSKTESRSVSGTPGISEIPGLNNLTGKDTEKDYATLLIVITPHLVRGTQATGHSPMIRIDQGQAAR
jgi:general secretion pathway protein D